MMCHALVLCALPLAAGWGGPRAVGARTSSAQAQAHVLVRARPIAAAPPPVKGSYYRRPAKAVERGGGFFIPGLEGDKLRLAAASFVSVALIANHAASEQPIAASQVTSEVIGAALCAWALVGVAVDRLVAEVSERGAQARSEASTGGSSETRGLLRISESCPPAAADGFPWVATCVLASTRGSTALLVRPADGAVLAVCGQLARDGAGPVLSEPARAAVARCAAGGAAVLDEPSVAESCAVASAAVCAASPELALVVTADAPSALADDDREWLSKLAARLDGAAMTGGSP